MIVYRRTAMIAGIVVVACVVGVFVSVALVPTGNTLTELAVGGIFLGLAGLTAAAVVIVVAWLVRLSRRRRSKAASARRQA